MTMINNPYAFAGGSHDGSGDAATFWRRSHVWFGSYLIGFIVFLCLLVRYPVRTLLFQEEGVLWMSHLVIPALLSVRLFPWCRRFVDISTILPVVLLDLAFLYKQVGLHLINHANYYDYMLTHMHSVPWWLSICAVLLSTAYWTFIGINLLSNKFTIPRQNPPKMNDGADR